MGAIMPARATAGKCWIWWKAVRLPSTLSECPTPKTRTAIRAFSRKWPRSAEASLISRPVHRASSQRAKGSPEICGRATPWDTILPPRGGPSPSDTSAFSYRGRAAHILSRVLAAPIDMKRPCMRRSSKTRRWIENIFLLAGLLGLAVWIWSVASRIVYQDWDNWAFDHQARGEQPTIGKYVAEKGARLEQRLRQRLNLPAQSGQPAPQPAPATQAEAPRIGRDGLVGRLTIPR